MTFVLLPQGKQKPQSENDYSHLGFSLGSRKEVTKIAEKARKQNCLVWALTDEPYPVGYYCGIKDPNRIFFEFSYGQPLGKGAP